MNILDNFLISFFPVKLPFRFSIGNPTWFANIGAFEVNRDTVSV